MWIPAQTTTPPLRTAASAAGTSSPAAAKMIAQSSSSGGRSSEPPAQAAPRPRANAWVARVARPREREERAALGDGDLGDHVGRGAEAVEADPLAVAGEPQRAEADQAGAQQRRDGEVVEAVGQREAVARVGDGELGVAAVDVAAREARAVAEVLGAGAGSSGTRRRSSPATGCRRACRARARRRRASSTVPTIWWPGTTGGRGIATSPSSRCRSVRQTPQAWTRTSSWPGPGDGVGELDGADAPGPAIWTARMRRRPRRLSAPRSRAAREPRGGAAGRGDHARCAEQRERADRAREPGQAVEAAERVEDGSWPPAPSKSRCAALIANTAQASAAAA